MDKNKNKLIENLENTKLFPSALKGNATTMLRNLKALQYADSEEEHKQQVNKIIKALKDFTQLYKTGCKIYFKNM